MTGRMSKPTRRQLLKAAGAASLCVGFPYVARAQTLKTFKMLQASNSPTLAWTASHLAESLGYFKDAGIELERIANNSGPAALTALVAGSGHANQSAPGEFIVAATKGQKLKVIAALSNYNALYLVVSKAYAAKFGVTEESSLQDRLAVITKSKGIKCGISAPGSQTDTTTRVILKNAKLDPDTDVQLIPLGSTVNSLAALERGAIDAFLASPPVPELAFAQFGAVRLLSIGNDEVPGFKAVASHGILTRAADVEKYPDLYQGVVLGITRAMRYIVEDPAAAGDVAYKAAFSNAVDAKIWPMVWEDNRSQFRTPYMKPENLEAWVKFGLVPNVSDPKAFNAEECIDMRFVDEAVKKLGWQVPT